jgi:predicted TIM-barrel fold metal-dependent hydrolase
MVGAEPLIPFVDSHVHLWDHSVADVSWTWMKAGSDVARTSGTAEVDAPAYGPTEFMAEASGSGAVSMIAVHSATLESDPRAEMAWLQSISSSHSEIAGAVGFCRLSSPEAVAVLRDLADLPIVRGVRDLTVSQGLDRPAVSQAMAAAADLGLAVEMRPPLRDFAVMRELAEKWPDAKIVLGHAGLPRERTEAKVGEWREALDVLADAPNVYCKISALASASAPNWTIDSIRPLVLACVDSFGPDRCMFATNWPFDRPWGDHTRLVDAYRDIAGAFAPEGRHSMFHGTAEHVYDLEAAGVS